MYLTAGALPRGWDEGHEEANTRAAGLRLTI